MGAIATLYNHPNAAVPPTILSLILAFPPIRRAWVSARGTALRPAIIWAAVAIGLTLLAQILSLQEPASTGRPLAGQVIFYVTPTNIVVVADANAPTIVSGYIDLEYLSLF